MLEAEEEVNEETPLKELDKVEESSSASSSFSVRDALVSSCRNFAAKFIPRRATPTQPVEQTPDAAFANVMSAMDGSTTGQNKPQQRRRRSSAAKHGDSDSSGSEEDTSDEEDEKKGGPGESKEGHVKGAPLATCCAFAAHTARVLPRSAERGGREWTRVARRADALVRRPRAVHLAHAHQERRPLPPEDPVG